MGFGPQYSAPDPSLGYYRGAPIGGGGYGTAMGKTAGMNQQAPGIATFGSQQWHPTVRYMLALVVVEMIGFAWLARHAR